MTKYNRKQELLSKIRQNIKRQDCKAVLRIRILLFLGLPDSDPLVRDLKNDVNVTSKSNKQKNFEFFCCWWLEGHWRKWQDPDPHPDPDPLGRGLDPRIRIRTKISRIRNTAANHDVNTVLAGIALEFMASCDYGIVREWHDDVELDAVQDPLLCDRVLTRPVPLLPNTNLKSIT